jgi:hypothetical protein
MPLKSPEPLLSPALKVFVKTAKPAAPEAATSPNHEIMNDAEDYVASEGANSSVTSRWGDVFKKFEEGKWKCEVCLARNEEENAKCAACEANRPGAASNVAAVSGAASVGFTFGASAAIGTGTSGLSFGKGGTGAFAFSSSSSNGPLGGGASGGASSSAFTFPVFGAPK